MKITYLGERRSGSIPDWWWIVKRCGSRRVTYIKKKSTLFSKKTRSNLLWSSNPLHNGKFKSIKMINKIDRVLR